MSLTGLRYGGLLCRRCHLITMMTPKKALNLISQSQLSFATQSPQHTAAATTKRSLLFPSQSIHLQRGIFNQSTSSMIYENDFKSTAIGSNPKSGIYFNHRSFQIYSRKHQASIDAEGAGTASSKAGEEKEQKKSRWSNWTGKNAWKGGILLLFLYVVPGGVFVVCSYGAPEMDEEGNEIKDAYTDSPLVLAYIRRSWQAMRAFFQMVRDPTSEKLLPDPLKSPYIQPPYTLVLEITDLLLKPEWDMKMGWRFKKRPGLDYFLQQCAQNGYEIVIFSNESASVGFPLTVSMDPQGTVWYRLFKEDTRYTSGVHIKDLSCLNRDLSRIILVDVCKSSYKLNPRSGITLNKWNGKDDDRELYDLSAFLYTVAANRVEDVRSVLDYYNQFDDPMQKFRENQAEIAKAQSDIMKLQQEEAKKGQISKSPFIPSNLGRR